MKRNGWIWCGVLLLGLLGGGMLLVDGVLDQEGGGQRPGAKRSVSGSGPERRAWRKEVSGDGVDARAESAELGVLPVIVQVMGPLGPGPSQGATVLLDGEPIGVSDVLGRWRFSVSRDGQRHELGAESGEALAAPVFFDATRGIRPPLERTLVLRQAGRLAGLVLGADGAPVEGAEVSLDPAVKAPQLSGPGGGFDFGALAAGAYRVAAARGSEGAKVPVSVRPGERRTLSLVLSPRGRFSAQLVDPQGMALPGIEVQVLRESGLAQTLVTDAEGSFEIAQIDDFMIRMSVDDQGWAASYHGVPAPGLQIVAVRGASLEVYLRDQDHRPVEAARLWVEVLNLRTDSPGRLALDAGASTGTYQRTGIPPGEWVIREERYGSANAPLATLRLTSGEHRILALALPPLTGVLSGRVLLVGTSQPQAGVVVRVGNNIQEVFSGRWANAPRATTSADGRFHVEGIAPAHGVIGLEKEGRLPASHRIGEDERTGREMTLFLEPGRRVSGQVLDSERLPVPDFSIDGERLHSSAGRFEHVMGVEARVLRFAAEGYGSKEVALSSGEGPVDLGEIVLTRAEPIWIRVLTPAGKPALGATVRARADREVAAGEDPLREDRIFFSAGTNQEGWTILELPEGVYVFSAGHPRHARSLEHSRKTGGGDRITLTLKVGTFVHGWGGKAGYKVLAVSLQKRDWNQKVTVDGKGGYRIGPLQAGRYLFTRIVIEAGKNLWYEPGPLIEVKAGDERKLDFDDPRLWTLRVTLPEIYFGYVRLLGPGEHDPELRHTVLEPGMRVATFRGFRPGRFSVSADGDLHPDVSATGKPGATTPPPSSEVHAKKEVLLRPGTTVELSLP